jgi:hypothetical protein
LPTLIPFIFLIIDAVNASIAEHTGSAACMPSK